MSNNNASLPGAVLAAGTFCFSPLIWQYAVTAEVFPLNTMFASVLVYLTARFGKSGDVRLSLLGALICGLALCNQHTIVLFVVPLVLWMFLLQRRRFTQSPALLLWHGVLFLLGFSFYLYLPIAAVLNPTPGSWGDVTTWSGFIHHFLRRDYGTFQLFSGNGGKQAEGFSERTWAYIEDATFVQGLCVIPLLAAVAVLVTCGRSSECLRGGKPKGGGRGPAVKDFTMRPAMSQATRTGKHKRVTGAPSVPTAPEGNVSCSPDSVTEVSLDEAAHTPTVLVGTLVFYFLVFHSLSNLPLGDKLLYGVHQRFWMQVSSGLIGMIVAHTVSYIAIAAECGGLLLGWCRIQ